MLSRTDNLLELTRVKYFKWSSNINNDFLPGKWRHLFCSDFFFYSNKNLSSRDEVETFQSAALFLHRNPTLIGHFLFSFHLIRFAADAFRLFCLCRFNLGRRNNKRKLDLIFVNIRTSSDVLTFNLKFFFVFFFFDLHKKLEGLQVPWSLTCQLYFFQIFEGSTPEIRKLTKFPTIGHFVFSFYAGK